MHCAPSYIWQVATKCWSTSTLRQKSNVKQTHLLGRCSLALVVVSLHFPSLITHSLFLHFRRQDPTGGFTDRWLCRPQLTVTVTGAGKQLYRYGPGLVRLIFSARLIYSVCSLLRPDFLTGTTRALSLSGSLQSVIIGKTVSPANSLKYFQTAGAAL